MTRIKEKPYDALYLCSMTRKDLLTLIGFVLFILGFTALSLSLVGIRWSFLSWIDTNPLWGLVGKVAMVIFGVMIVAIAQTDFKSANEE